MQTKDLLFLWGVVASLVLLADGSTIPSAGRVAAKFEGKGFANLPSLDAPTEKEWLEIIEGTHRGEPVPRYLAERNYTFHVNETGEFSTSDGFKGHWNQTEYLHYRVVGDQSHRVVFHIEDIHLGHLHLAVVMKSVATFTATGDESYVSARAVGGETFVKENETWVQGGSFLGFGEGEGIFVTKDHLQFMDLTHLLVNSSHSYSVSQEELQGLITVGQGNYHMDGVTFRNSIPLSGYGKGGARGLPKTPEALARLYRERTEVSTPFIAATLGTVKGEQTVGLEGKIKGEIDSVTRIFPDRTFNSTTTIEATFSHETSSSSSSTDTHLLQVQNLLDAVAKSFLH